jgi:hypothetical protein
MLPVYEKYLKDKSFLFPTWSEPNAKLPKKWNVRAFFKRTLGIIANSTTLRSIIEMTAAQLHAEKKINDSTR